MTERSICIHRYTHSFIEEVERKRRRRRRLSEFGRGGRASCTAADCSGSVQAIYLMYTSAFDVLVNKTHF